ncbi:MAG: ParB/RepB/Spo0J family partition protein [Oligoflexales bacterium]|nr:ParB/RepB/Spo0J family partition protein [Oligoflexales bacterium]
MKKSKAKSKLASKIASTVKGVEKEFKDHKKVDAQAEWYLSVKEVFKKVQQKGKGSLPSVRIDEIDLSQNSREIDTSTADFVGLRESIKEQGLLQRPVLTLGLSTSKPFLCVAGHRRIMALKELGYETCPAELIYSENEQDIHLARLAENLVRQNLKPLELAESVLNLKERLNETTTGVARILNKHRGYVVELLKIAKWPNDAKQLIKEHDINIRKLGHIAKKKMTDSEVIEALLALVNVSGSPTEKKDVRKNKFPLRTEKFYEYCNNKKFNEDQISFISSVLSELKLVKFESSDTKT